jgi:polar amino acid transport system substrate-binding protein
MFDDAVRNRPLPPALGTAPILRARARGVAKTFLLAFLAVAGCPPFAGANAATGNPADRVIQGTNDLDGLRIAVLQGSAQEGFARNTYPNATVLAFTAGVTDINLALSTAKADVAMGDEPAVLEVLATEKNMTMLREPLFGFPLGVGFNKSNTALREQFNVFLKELRRTGEYDQLFKRWKDENTRVMPAIANDGRNGVLRAGVNAANPPYLYVQNGEIVGIDAELINRFAASLGRRVEYSNMEFGSLVAAVATGKMDLVSSSIFITPERLKRIDFSDPYDQVYAVAYALKNRVAPAAGGTAGLSTGNVDTPADKDTPSGFLGSLRASVEDNLIKEDRYLLIWKGLKTTILISVLATLFGTVLGALVCYMRMSPSRWLNGPARAYISLLRGLPVLVLLMLIFYVVFASVDISPMLVAVIAFGMNFAAYVSEMFRTGIEGVDRGQSEAGIAMGFSPTSTFLHIVMPQALLRILPVYKGEFISLVKMTSIVGYIAVEDLTKASDLIRSRTFDAFFPLVLVAILYFLVSWALLQLLEYLEHRMDPKRRRVAGGAA